MSTPAIEESDVHVNGIDSSYGCEPASELIDNNCEGHNKNNNNQEYSLPFTGMEFQSLEEAFEYYTKFAKREGFGIRKSKSASLLRVHRKRTTAQRNLIDLIDDSGIRPSKIMFVLATESGGIDTVGLTSCDIQNYLSNRRQKGLEKGNAQLMLNYFQECQSKNPGFFYSLQMDSEGQLANHFWADSRSRMAYEYFGDVVAFDPTYLTNKYQIPFVPFTDVNHHHQSILFGCALLWDETEETFVWLLNTWLEEMCGQHPRTVIADQDAAIANAIERVLPNTVHHYCMWHIEKKAPEYLSHVFHQFDDFKDNFFQCIHYALVPDEFESKWAKIIEKYGLQENSLLKKLQIIEKYGLQENSWLKKLHSIREKWIPAYVRNNFWVGMSTTQRSEKHEQVFQRLCKFKHTNDGNWWFEKLFDELDALKLEDDKPDNTNVLTNNNDLADDVSKDHGNHLDSNREGHKYVNTSARKLTGVYEPPELFILKFRFVIFYLVLTLRDILDTCDARHVVQGDAMVVHSRLSGRGVTNTLSSAHTDQPNITSDAPKAYHGGNDAPRTYHGLEDDNGEQRKDVHGLQGSMEMHEDHGDIDEHVPSTKKMPFDPLKMSLGPMTRARAKRFKGALMGLVRTHLDDMKTIQVQLKRFDDDLSKKTPINYKFITLLAIDSRWPD
ncbi:hypothetical protein CCACVL1_09531 [Corchorus capsularis]|uniref:MULE transposase domain-containing protein n=1 Tax=Corchorus capsularis TaxID=210143 RepID=A0A1R3IVU9_COCAP|nr:hypothetical protein CCACVL1_09531 [Corchorus capsularis]